MHTLKLVFFALLIALAPAVGVHPAHASLGVDFTDAADLFSRTSDDDINIIGWQFAVNQSLTIDRLGYFDYLGNSLTGSHEVALYDASGNRLAYTTVSGADPLLGNGFFRVHGIDAVTLQAGQSYVLAATAGSDLYTATVGGYVFSNLVWNTGITFLTDVFDSANFTLPATWTSTESAGVVGGFGPNFAQAVPIPGAIYLFGSGLAGLIGLRRRLNG